MINVPKFVLICGRAGSTAPGEVARELSQLGYAVHHVRTDFDLCGKAWVTRVPAAFVFDFWPTPGAPDESQAMDDRVRAWGGEVWHCVEPTPRQLHRTALVKALISEPRFIHEMDAGETWAAAVRSVVAIQPVRPYHLVLADQVAQGNFTETLALYRAADDVPGQMLFDESFRPPGCGELNDGVTHHNRGWSPK